MLLFSSAEFHGKYKINFCQTDFQEIILKFALFNPIFSH